MRDVCGNGMCAFSLWIWHMLHMCKMRGTEFWVWVINQDTLIWCKNRIGRKWEEHSIQHLFSHERLHQIFTIKWTVSCRPKAMQTFTPGQTGSSRFSHKIKCYADEYQSAQNRGRISHLNVRLLYARRKTRIGHVNAHCNTTLSNCISSAQNVIIFSHRNLDAIEYHHCADCIHDVRAMKSQKKSAEMSETVNMIK